MAFSCTVQRANYRPPVPATEQPRAYLQHHIHRIYHCCFTQQTCAAATPSPTAHAHMSQAPVDRTRPRPPCASSTQHVHCGQVLTPVCLCYLAPMHTCTGRLLCTAVDKESAPGRGSSNLHQCRRCGAHQPRRGHRRRASGLNARRR